MVPTAQARVQTGGTYYSTGEYGAPSTIGLGPQTSQAVSERSATTQRYTTAEYGAPSTIGLGPQTSESVSQGVVAVSGDGFNWGDAGIGAGTVFGVALILGSALLLSRRRQGHLAV